MKKIFKIGHRTREFRGCGADAAEPRRADRADRRRRYQHFFGNFIAIFRKKQQIISKTA